MDSVIGKRKKKNPKISHTSWQEKAIQWKCIRHFNFTSSFYFISVFLSHLFQHFFATLMPKLNSEWAHSGYRHRLKVHEHCERMRYIFAQSDESSSNQYTDLLAQVCKNALSINLWQYLFSFLSSPHKICDIGWIKCVSECERGIWW